MENKAYLVIAVAVPVAVLILLCGNAVYNEIAVVIAVKPADDVEHGGLSRAALAENRDKFVFPKTKADLVKGGLHKIAGLVNFDYAFKLKHKIPPAKYFLL